MDIMRHKDIAAPVCIIKTVLNVLVAVPLALFAISVCADVEVGMKKDTVDAGTDMTTSIVGKKMIIQIWLPANEYFEKLIKNYILFMINVFQRLESKNIPKFQSRK